MSVALSAADPATDPVPNRKREAMLEAAGELFLAEGYAAVSMDAVARRAAVSKATLYAHFTSKDALFGAVVEARCAIMADRLDVVAGHDRPLRDALAALGRHLVDFFLAPRVLMIFRIALAEGLRFPALAETYFRSGPALGRSRTAEWMAEEQRRGRLREDADPREAAEHFISMLRGTVLIRGALGIGPAPTDEDLDRAVAAVTDVMMRAYGAPGA